MGNVQMTHRMDIYGIEAVLFDMDGTLVDSEILTEQIIHALLAEQGVTLRGIDPHRFHGVTWSAIEGQLQALYPKLRAVPLARPLADRFQQLFVDEPPPLIPGAAEALVAAGRRGPTAIVTSSEREGLDAFLARLELGDALAHSVCADDFTRSKPDPECFQLAARRLSVDPTRCLVFEDSVAGLQAARSAGMATVAIVRDERSRKLTTTFAELQIADYTELPERFFDSIR